MTIEIGKRYKFKTISEEYQSRNNEKCKVIRPLTKEEADIEEIGKMYKVVFEDGTEADVFEDELEEI